MKPFIALIAAGFLTATAMAADIEAAPIFQMRLVAETPSATSELMSMVSKNGDRSVTNTLNIEKAVLIDQKALKSAWVGKDSRGRPTIEIECNEKGSEQLTLVTEQNFGKRVAIIIDGRLIEVPRVLASITGGAAQISGNFSKEEANDLANRINAVAKK